MPIEFQCSGCGKLLRVPDEFAGKQARCPHCSAVSQAPAAPASAAGRPLPEFAPNVDPDAERPPEGPGGASPYQAPQTEGLAAPISQIAKSKVDGPGLALIIVGGLDLAFCVIAVVANIFQIAFFNAQFAGQQGFPGGGQFPFNPGLGLGFNIFSTLIKLGISGLLIYGGMQMRKLKNYGWSMAAAIMAIVPCFGGCCLWDLPIGIWALVVLVQGDVTAAFKQNEGVL